jgi:catechol 2,3-dioxygenase-like lactoylglutathione lyase family enzyme
MVSIGNVAIYVSDLEASERFYVDGLGLEVLARVEAPEVREVIVGRPGEGSQLMLAWLRTPTAPIEPAGIWKIFLFADDAQSLYDAAIAAGAEPVEAPMHLEQFKVTIALVKDLDGYVVEIGQRDDASPARNQ